MNENDEKYYREWLSKQSSQELIHQLIMANRYLANGSDWESMNKYMSRKKELILEEMERRDNAE